MKTLKDVGYEGYIGLETQAPGPDPFESIKTDDSIVTVDCYLKESIDILRAMEKAI